MKDFVRIEPTTTQEVGKLFKQQTVVKRYRTEDGLEHEFTTFGKEHSHSAAVIAITANGQVVTSHQFRAGRERYLNDLPGGRCETDETHRQTAERELLEEAGYIADEFRYLGAYGWNANINLTSHYYLATNARPAEKRTFEQIEVDQGLETVLISIEELIKNAKTDQMTDAVAVFMAYDALIEMHQNLTKG